MMPQQSNFDPYNSGIRIRNFLLIETVNLNYSSMFIRPFTFTSITDKNISRLEDAVRSSFGGKDNMSELSCVQSFGNLFGISNRPLTGIELPNGNRQSRFKFILDLEKPVGIGNQYSNTSRYIIQGFSSSNEILYRNGSWLLPSDLEFHINSITEFYSSLRSDGSLDVRLIDSYNTISAMNLYNQQEALNLVATRARDINQVLLLKEEDMDYSQGQFATPGLDFSSIGSVSSTDVLTSTRVNSDPVGYLRRLLNSYREGHAIASHGSYGEDTYGLNKVSSLDNATRACAEPIFLRNSVIQFLASIANHAKGSNVIQFNLLELAFGNIRDIIKVISGNQAQTYENSVYGRRREIGLQMEKLDPNSTIRTDIITSKMLELNSSISSHMSRVGLTECTIRLGYAPANDTFLSNHSTGSSSIVAAILSAQSLLGDNYVIPAVSRFETILRTMVIPSLVESFSNTPFSVIIDANMLADTALDVYVPAYNFTESYRFPTFCDSLYMPVLSTREERSMLCNELQQIHEMMDATI